MGARLDGAAIGPRKRTQRGPHFRGSDNGPGMLSMRQAGERPPRHGFALLRTCCCMRPSSMMSSQCRFVRIGMSSMIMHNYMCSSRFR